jgi:hypothetical protein
MPDVKVMHRKQSGGAISTGNRRVKTTVKCVSISPRGGPLLLSRCMGAASKRILPDLSALSKCQYRILSGEDMFSY